MNVVIRQNCLIFCRFSICSKNVQLVLSVLDVVNDPRGSCLYESRWLKGMSAVNQPNFWACLAVTVDSEKVPVFCAVKVYKESVGNYEKTKPKKPLNTSVVSESWAYICKVRNSIPVSRLEKFQTTWLPDLLLLHLPWNLKPLNLVCETRNLQGKQFSCCPTKSRILHHWASLEAHWCIQALKFRKNVEILLNL